MYAFGGRGWCPDITSSPSFHRLHCLYESHASRDIETRLHFWGLISCTGLRAYPVQGSSFASSYLYQNLQFLARLVSSYFLLPFTGAACHRETWTEASLTRVHAPSPVPAGAWSTVQLTTFAASGRPKTTGGDAWDVVLHDAEQCLRVPSRVLDLGNGSYSVAFLPHFPGNYTLVMRLAYSDCNAIMDPPGDAERETLSEEGTCYIGSKVTLPGAVHVTSEYARDSCDVGAPGRWGAAAVQGAGTSGVPPGSEAGGVVIRGEEAAVRRIGSIVFLPCCTERLRGLAQGSLDPGSRSGPHSGHPSGHTAFAHPQHAGHGSRHLEARVQHPAVRGSTRGPGPRVTRLLLWGDSTVKRQWLMLLMLARQHCRITWEPRAFEEQYTPEACEAVPPDQLADPELETLLRQITSGLPWTDIPVATNTIEVSRYFPLAGLADLHNATFWDAVLQNSTALYTPSAGEEGFGEEPGTVRRRRMAQVRIPCIVGCMCDPVS